MITDERLKEIVDGQRIDASVSVSSGYVKNHHSELVEALTELLSSRQTIKRLVEAGRTMRNCIAGQIMAIDETGAIDGFMGMSITQEGYDVLKRIVKDYTPLLWRS